MSDEITPAEELPMEDKKKAINLQDLAYVKQYIDMNHYSKDETDAMLSSEVSLQVNAKVAETTYSKTEIDANHYTKKQIDDNNYTKTQANETFYKKTDTVVNAINAANAENADHATNADYATNAGHATTATNADNATNAVVKDDGSYVGLTIGEDGQMKAGGENISIAHATEADSAASATYAQTAGVAESVENATYAETAGHATNATFADNATNAANAAHADNADNAVNAIKNSDGSYSGFTKDSSNILKTDGEVIERKRLIFNTPTGIDTTNGYVNITFSETLTKNDVIEIHFYYDNNPNNYGVLRFKTGQSIHLRSINSLSFSKNYDTETQNYYTDLWGIGYSFVYTTGGNNHNGWVYNYNEQTWVYTYTGLQFTTNGKRVFMEIPNSDSAAVKINQDANQDSKFVITKIYKVIE